MTADLDLWLQGRIASSTQPESIEAPETEPLATRSSPTRNFQWLGVWLAAVALICTVVWISRGRNASHGGIQTIVVLPFTDDSENQDLEYVVDGLTDQVIDALCTTPGLRVVARTSAFQYKKKARDARAIGHELGVDAIVEGGVRKSDSKLRINAKLIRASDGLSIWSRTWDVKQGDLLATEDQIAAGVAARLDPKLAVRVARPEPRDRCSDGRCISRGQVFVKPSHSGVHEQGRTEVS